MKLIIVASLCLVCVCCLPNQQQKSLLKTYLKLNGRIVGGDEASPGQFPWQVAVYLDTDDGTYFCSGALIDPQWVLTAGHCVYGAKIFTLRLGTNSLVDADPNRVEFTVTHSVAHPDFNPGNLENDIGLIKIDSGVETTDFIQIIPLASTPVGGSVPVTVSGWGSTGDWDGAVNHLNYVTLRSLTLAECREIYGPAVTEGMLCAVGNTNEGTCSGDSGGPLVVTDTNGVTVHAGIVSWASASGCETDHPSGFTRTSYYLDWIQSVING
ncbi:hypothetical protein Zmor_025916 [Zophobas morio]|uniref:Peptidase S1 domain-containing protein n=1 Tax=Zophobas morio TaxID=2755281 RepID=A0AA38M4M3_9CUCU|nr:hypothetical protein Zmor_025916 [Zophobas morio]